MSRSDIDCHFSKIDELVKEINRTVPNDGSHNNTSMRSDLAGLLVVAISATYETCVKDVLINHASQKHGDFGDFTSRNFRRLNSKVKVNDLKNYCKLYCPNIEIRFRQNLSKNKSKILSRTNRNIEDSYEQILNWRHDFAHAWSRVTTIEEAYENHILGKRVIYALDSAFS